jgi:hypothetical protein
MDSKTTFFKIIFEHYNQISNGKVNSELYATSNLGIRLNLKLVLYLEDLANPNNGLNFVPNFLWRWNVGGKLRRNWRIK